MKAKAKDTGICPQRRRLYAQEFIGDFTKTVDLRLCQKLTSELIILQYVLSYFQLICDSSYFAKQIANKLLNLYFITNSFLQLEFSFI